MTTSIFLDKRQLADQLNLPSTRSIDQLMARHQIPYHKLGHKTVRFELAKVLSALASNCEVRARC